MAESDAPALHALAEHVGVEREYEDARGELKRASVKTLRAILDAMGLRASDEREAAETLAELTARNWERPTPAVQVCDFSRGRPEIEVIVPKDTPGIEWSIRLESGQQLSGSARAEQMPLRDRSPPGVADALERRTLALPEELPPGYHCFSLSGASADTALILSPGRCWTPDGRDAGHRVARHGERAHREVAPRSGTHRRSGARHWGLAAQLYTVRSANNWGIGDFSDLHDLVRLTQRVGGDVVGINPLHALFPANPQHASPYSPSSRLLLNVLYIDVTAVAEFVASAAAQGTVHSAAFQQRVQRCREADLVDYSSVAELKLAVLHELFGHFITEAESDRRAAFDGFRRAQGETFELACVFQALLEHLSADDSSLRDVRRWPAEFAHAQASGVTGFRAQHAERITELVWLQWIADEQLAAATRAGDWMTVGLYRDLAVGADASGAEPWIRPHAFARAQIGAPPDLFNPDGQNWGLPVPHPAEWQAEGYASFIEMLRANMRYAGALRIDHAMGLQHLYWIPHGASAAEGAYVKYPFDHLLAILALESQRHRCMVVGEDLGTVPRGFRERMNEAGVLSYRVLFFEREPDNGPFLAAETYPSLSLAVTGNHDLPTLRGWWTEESTSQDDRVQLCRALGLATSPMPDPDDVMVAAHEFLMRSPASIVLAQLDDLTRESQPVNKPAETDYPNWQRRLSIALEDLPEKSLLSRIAGWRRDSARLNSGVRES